jgi:queuine tRNA-ribosyltransferase
MNAIYKQDARPIDEDCTCYTCRTFTRAYLRHLIVAKELLAGTLLSIHNLHALIQLVEDIRESIQNNTFESNLQSWLLQWQGNAERTTPWR